MHCDRRSLELTTHQVRLTAPRSRTSIEAGVLHVVRDDAGEPIEIWCDRRIHSSETDIAGWAASGAVVTVFTRT